MFGIAKNLSLSQLATTDTFTTARNVGGVYATADASAREKIHAPIEEQGNGGTIAALTRIKKRKFPMKSRCQPSPNG